MATSNERETAITVHKQTLNSGGPDWTHLEIRLEMALPVSVRLDRLLALEFGISRNALRDLAKQGALCGKNGAPLQLKKPPKDGTLVCLQLVNQPALKAQLNATLFALEASD